MDLRNNKTVPRPVREETANETADEIVDEETVGGATEDRDTEETARELKSKYENELKEIIVQQREREMLWQRERDEERRTWEQQLQEMRDQLAKVDTKADQTENENEKTENENEKRENENEKHENENEETENQGRYNSLCRWQMDLENKSMELQYERKLLELERELVAARSVNQETSSGVQQSVAKIFGGTYDSALPLNNPAVDVVTELMGCVELPEAVQNDKKDVMTVTRLYEYALEKSVSLAEMVRDKLDGSSLRVALERFTNAFRAGRQVPNTILWFIKILCLKHQCPLLSSKLDMAIKYAGSVTHEVRLSQLSKIKATGDLPGLSQGQESKSMRELMGIAEMRNMASSEEGAAVESFGETVVSYMLFEMQ